MVVQNDKYILLCSSHTHPMYQSQIIYLVIVDCLQKNMLAVRISSDDQKTQLVLAGYYQISEYCQGKKYIWHH